MPLAESLLPMGIQLAILLAERLSSKLQ